MLVKIPDLQAKVAKASRASLEKAKDPERLKDYEFLWGMEFRTTSPKDFPALRQQVAADLKRLEHANPHPDAAWAQLLLHWQQECGCQSRRPLPASEDALIAKYPHSERGLSHHRVPLEQGASRAGCQRRRRMEKVSRRPEAMPWRNGFSNFPMLLTPLDSSRYLYLSPVDDSRDGAAGRRDGRSLSQGCSRNGRAIRFRVWRTQTWPSSISITNGQSARAIATASANKAIARRVLMRTISSRMIIPRAI